MRLALAASLTVLAILVPRPASAVPFTPDLDALRTTLETRRDTEFPGTLDRPTLRKQRAVLRSLVRLERTADDEVDDAKTLGAVARILESVYPEGMAPATADNVGQAALTASSDLFVRYLDAKGEVEAKLFTSVPGRVTTRAAKLVARSEAVLESELELFSEPVSFQMKLIVRAWKSIVRAAPIAAAAPDLPAPTATFLYGTTEVTTDQVFWQYTPASDRLLVIIAGTDDVTGDQYAIQVPITLVDGQTEYEFSGSAYVVLGAGGESTEDFFGTLSAEDIDIPGRSYIGAFTGTVLGPMETSLSGSFTATTGLEIVVE